MPRWKRLFASILLHELGHSVVARRHGVEINRALWALELRSGSMA